MASSDARFPPTAECQSMHIALCVFAALMWITIGTRFVARQRKRIPVGWDDFLAFTAGLGATASVTIFGFLIRTGVGYHIYDHEWDTVRALTFELESKVSFNFIFNLKILQRCGCFLSPPPAAPSSIPRYFVRCVTTSDL
ncbi:hypothetical protein GGS26DRAFT_437093 [Hypomontagnella submonticulosa]|nr:hypothetical protein GGS26DRAFT_437093 [Hypomontagnella submonticulosa]